MFIVYEELHGEPQEGHFSTFEDALNMLRERSKIPWNKNPNKCPCSNWKECKRIYHIIEYDVSSEPWQELNNHEVLTLSEEKTLWNKKIKTLYNTQ